MKLLCPKHLLFLLPAAFLFFLPSAKSQIDGHYWTQQYGAKGLLLNGAVIASTEDETATFYNPGAMGNGEDFGVSLSFFTPTYSVLRTEGYLGSGSRVNDTGLGFAPGYGAVGFKPFRTDKLRASLTSFSRYKSGLGLRERTVGQVQNDSSRLFLGDLDFRRSLSERWYGFGLAFQFSDNFSFGATQFVAFHSENTSLSVQKEIVAKDNPHLLLLGWRTRFKYSLTTRAGMLTKFGVSANLGKLKIGLTATTPTYFTFRKKASYESADLRVYGADSTVLVANRDAAALENLKSPWSIGLGLDFQVKKTRCSISAEYFGAIPAYTVIDDVDDPFDGLATGNFDETTRVMTANRAVMNVGIGLQTLRPNGSTLIWGFRTDFNQRVIDQELQTLSFLSTSPSIFHLSFGGLFSLYNNQFSIGVDYAFGKKRTTGRLVDLSNITEENLFEFSDNGGILTKYRSFVFIFTYDFILKSWKEVRKRMGERRNGGKKK